MEDIMKTFTFIFAASLALILLNGCDSEKDAKTEKMDHSNMKMVETPKAPASQDGINELKEQTTCPVMGSPIKKDLYVDKDGKRIYYCCAGCKEPLEKEFEKYEVKLKEMGQKVEILK